MLNKMTIKFSHLSKFSNNLGIRSEYSHWSPFLGRKCLREMFDSNSTRKSLIACWASVTSMAKIYLLKGQSNFVNRIIPVKSKIFEKFCQTDFLEVFWILNHVQKKFEKIRSRDSLGLGPQIFFKFCMDTPYV